MASISVKHQKKLRIQPPKTPHNLQIARLFSFENELELSGMAIHDVDVSHQSAHDIVLHNIQFTKTIFNATEISGAFLNDILIDSCDFSGAQWHNSDWNRISLTASKLVGIQLQQVTLNNIVFKECNFSHAIFSSGTCKSVRFEKCNVREAFFDKIDFCNTTFDHCDLARADMSNCVLHDLDVRGSTIDGIRILPQQWNGTTIDPLQAQTVATLLGITVKSNLDTLDEY